MTVLCTVSVFTLFKTIVIWSIPFTENYNYIDASQLICNINQLASFDTSFSCKKMFLRGTFTKKQMHKSSFYVNFGKKLL